MDNKTEGYSWNGRKIAKDDDKHDLESRAAVYEFKHRMARGDAEHRAHHEYKQDKHREAAAYHLQGLKAAQGAGSHEEGHKHGMMYQLHMKELGLDPMGPVPHEIKGLADKQENFYKFKAHRGDAFLLQDGGDDAKKGDVKKSEADHKCTTCGFVQPPADRAKNSAGCKGGKAHSWPEPVKKGDVIPFKKPAAVKPPEPEGFAPPAGWDAAVKETIDAGPQKLGNVTNIASKIQARKKLASTKVQGILDDAAGIMASDPGFQDLARKRDVQMKADKLKQGGQKFKPGQTVTHVDQQSVPWKGKVQSANYRENDVDGPGHYYEVKWWNPKLNQYHEDYLHQDNLKPG